MAFLLVLQPEADAERQLRARLSAQPGAVRTFIGRRALCNHFGGEEPYDEARRRDILRALNELRCKRLDKDEAKLRRRYGHRPDMLRLLADTADLFGPVE